MYPVVLTIAGSDPSGGAGIQADLKTFMAYEVYGTAVITAVTAQNTRGVRAVNPLPPEWVREQLVAVLEDLPPLAIKLGLLPTPACIQVVAETLSAYGYDSSLTSVPVIVDPVGVASSGHLLAEPGCPELLKEIILPQTTLVTPNLPELFFLTGRSFTLSTDFQPEVIAAGKSLLERGVKAVLAKGGHGGGEWSIDILISAQGIKDFRSRRIWTQHGHGTGCTLSAAIAAGLARGWPLEKAIKKAKRYVTRALANALALGDGSGPLDHRCGWKDI